MDTTPNQAPAHADRKSLVVACDEARERTADGLLAAWIERYGLSGAEAETLRGALGGLGRNEIAAARGVSPNTAKHQIGRLLARVGAASLDEMRVLFFRELSDTLFGALAEFLERDAAATTGVQ